MENVSGRTYMNLYKRNKIGGKLPSTIPNLETNHCGACKPKSIPPYGSYVVQPRH